MRGPLSTAGGEQTRERRHRVPLHGIVDVPLLFATFEQPGAPERVQVMRQRRPGDLDLRLDLADRHLALGPDEEEEDLQPREVGERLERLDMLLGCFQSRQGEGGHDFHISIYIEVWRRGQVVGRPATGLTASAAQGRIARCRWRQPPLSDPTLPTPYF